MKLKEQVPFVHVGVQTAKHIPNLDIEQPADCQGPVGVLVQQWLLFMNGVLYRKWKNLIRDQITNEVVLPDTLRWTAF